MPDKICKLHEKMIIDIEKRQIKIEGDISHIRDRIDNGMSKTITKIYEKIEIIMPVVEDSRFWINKLKWALAIVFFVGLMKLVWQHVPIIGG